MNLFGIAFAISIVIAIIFICIGIHSYREEENEAVMDNIRKSVIRCFKIAFLFVIIGISIALVGFCINILNR